ncbi:hypothetical protein Mboo_0717 [Methanoregula boonei 6A8]|uniref:Transposase IS4-like domain-containing protein n=1 Tax=Methanoregula boonei (strain DSM 21154 / JCM 14090 / 6A8) TaxID=456442 RepID=A7I674_METB6|nr:transposase [Methanoregula boonei]ABS55235.1 hypothetical protein Mboo_0717 [Methanoregula boonei 6A8]
MALAQTVIMPHLKLKTHHNCRFTQYDYFKVLAYAATQHCCAEGSGNDLKFSSDVASPTGEALLHHLKKFGITELRQSSQRAIDEIIRMAKSRGLLKGPVNVAIDYTDNPYYGNRRDPMVIGANPERGTDRVFRYATLTIIEKQCRLTIRAIPVYVGLKKHEVVADLISFANERIEIGVVCMDRGFFSAEVFALLDSMGINYLTPAVMTPRIIWSMRAQEPPKIIPITIGGYKGSKKVSTNMVIVLDEDMDRMTYVTNMELDRMHTRKLNKLYAMRWGIETAYRVTKGFRPKTTSKNYAVRLFYFLFSVCLYNLWEYLAMVLSAAKKDRKGISSITASLFGTILVHGFERCGTGPPIDDMKSSMRAVMDF